MPQSMSAAKHEIGMIVQQGLSQTTALRPWILRWVRLAPGRGRLPWEQPPEGDPAAP